MRPVAAPQTTLGTLGEQLARERRRIAPGRGLPRDALGAADLDPAMGLFEQLEQGLERCLIDPLRRVDAPHVIDDDRHRGARERRGELWNARSVHVDLQVPADIGQALRHRQHVVERVAGGDMAHVVEAHAAKTLLVQAFQLGSGRRSRRERNAAIVLVRSEQVGGGGIVEPVRGRLHDHAALDAEKLVQREQRLLGRVAGRRVAPLGGERKALLGPEDMEMRVARAARQPRLRFARLGVDRRRRRSHDGSGFYGQTMKIIRRGECLGATIEGLDLARPLQPPILSAVVQALGEHGVVRFPRQKLTAGELRDFSAQLGDLEINVGSAGFQEPGVPEVMILSNIVENGRPIGLADAGQAWHTDMSYSRMIAFANVLYGIRIPKRNGEPLGATQFSNMQAAYAGLPSELKRALEGKTVLHDFNKFWEMMRSEKGSKRPPLTEAQRKAKPPVAHPIFLTHPLTGRKVLYANPGYAVRINELPQKESDELLAFLFEHQVKPEYLYTFRWQPGDVLFWEDIGTIHNAVADYGPDEHRLIKRCQVMASRF